MKLTVEQHGPLIKERLEAGESYRTIANSLGCNKDTVAIFTKVNFPELRRNATQAQQREATVLPEQPTETELLKAELAKARATQRRHRTVDVQAELLLEEVRQQVTPADVQYEAPEDAEGSGKAHMQVLLLSDLHIGEVVVPEAVNGLNEYNWDIFVERMTEVQQALFSFQNNRPYPIDELVIALLGDNVSNNHHEELAVTNEFPITEQCYRGGVFLGQWIEALIPHYPSLRVVGVGGNHGRTKKAPASKQVFDSYDWLGYQYAKQHLANYNIDFHTPHAGMLVTQIAGRNMLVLHGDGIRSSMPGVPWGGVTRRVNELKKQYSESGVLIDYVALGHYHTANVVNGGRIFMNGSIMGLNEFGFKNFGSGEDPTQLLLTFNRDKQRLTDVSYITPSS